MIALNAGWNSRSDTEEGHFNFCVPLSMLLGFCEDYKRLIVNARHELILIRARNDNNYLVGNPVTESEVELFKVQWRMPHVALNEVNKLSTLQTLESDHYLSMNFRSWDLYEYPLLQNTTKHSWSKRRLSLRSLDTLSLLCRSVERISCHEMVACSTIVI